MYDMHYSNFLSCLKDYLRVKNPIIMLIVDNFFILFILFLSLFILSTSIEYNNFFISRLFGSALICLVLFFIIFYDFFTIIIKRNILVKYDYEEIDASLKSAILEDVIRDSELLRIIGIDDNTDINKLSVGFIFFDIPGTIGIMRYLEVFALNYYHSQHTRLVVIRGYKGYIYREIKLPQ